MAGSTRPLRILYAAGPGDVVGTYRHWKEGRDDPSEVAVTYSGQFYDLRRELGAEAYVIAYCDRRDRVVDGPVTVEHRPLRFQNGPGLLYHFGQIWSGLRLTITAMRFRPDVVVFMGGAMWFSIGLLPLFGARIIIALHAHLWRVAHPPRGFSSLIWKLNRRFFRRRVSGFVCVSDSVAKQLVELTGPLDVPVLRFVPTYRRETLSRSADDAPPQRPPFRVFFGGRIERKKGVFLLLDVAVRLAKEGRTDIEFDLCGSGSVLEGLRRAAEAAGVSARFRCHGHAEQSRMREMYERSHMVVVPTTTGAIEGLNKVVVEAVLAGRPVLTSWVCPALEYVRGAVVEVRPDDAGAYGDAILKLADDRSFYDEKLRGCTASTEQFYDPATGWGATVKRVMESAGVLGGARQAPVGEPAASARAAANAR